MPSGSVRYQLTVLTHVELGCFAHRLCGLEGADVQQGKMMQITRLFKV